MKSTCLSFSIVGMFSMALVGCAKHPVSENPSSSEVYPLPTPDFSIQSVDFPNSPPKPEVVGQTLTILPDIYQHVDESKTQIVRQGRYTLVNTSPEDGQKYLLEQMVSVNMTPKKKRAMTATVEQGLKTTLAGTGLSLCYGSNSNQTSPLFALPLPKVHYQFGPIKLREALQMLAGPAYYVTLNDITRTVCFETRETPVDIHKKRLEIISTTTKTEVIDE